MMSPGTVVIGGGVAQAEEQLFLQPLREAIAQYVMPALQGSYMIKPAKFGEESVVRGAIALVH